MLLKMLATFLRKPNNCQDLPVLILRHIHKQELFVTPDAHSTKACQLCLHHDSVYFTATEETRHNPHTYNETRNKTQPTHNETISKRAQPGHVMITATSKASFSKPVHMSSLWYQPHHCKDHRHSVGDMVYIMLVVFTSQDLFLAVNLGWVDLRAQENFGFESQWGRKPMATFLAGEHARQWAIAAPSL